MARSGPRKKNQSNRSTFIFEAKTLKFGSSSTPRGRAFASFSFLVPQPVICVFSLSNATLFPAAFDCVRAFLLHIDSKAHYCQLKPSGSKREVQGTGVISSWPFGFWSRQNFVSCGFSIELIASPDSAEKGKRCPRQIFGPIRSTREKQSRGQLCWRC